MLIGLIQHSIACMHTQSHKHIESDLLNKCSLIYHYYYYLSMLYALWMQLCLLSSLFDGLPEYICYISLGVCAVRFWLIVLIQDGVLKVMIKINVCTYSMDARRLKQCQRRMEFMFTQSEHTENV